MVRSKYFVFFTKKNKKINNSILYILFFTGIKMDYENDGVEPLNCIFRDDVEKETYIMHSRMCTRLSRDFSPNEMKCYEKEDLIDNTEQNIQPALKYGLENSEIIIPSYYKLHENPCNIIYFDYYNVIQDDIRNLRPLNSSELLYVKKLKDEYKDEIITLMNEVIYHLTEILKND